MAKQVLLYGTVANDGTGENLRAAVVKINENFTEVYNADTQRANDIAAVVAVKEPVLGNPDVDGKVLSSTAAGVRSWVTAGVGSGSDDPLAERTAAGTLVFPARYPVGWTYNADSTLNVGTATDGVTTWTMTFAYDVDGNVATMTAFNGVTTWVNTPTYVNGQMTTTSGWIQQ